MEEQGLHKKSYQIVIDYIKDQIREGKLEVGGKLPTERVLSEILGISRNSVREAMRSLEIMGIISSHQGAGNYLTGSFENNLVETLSMMFLLKQFDFQQISQLRRGLELQALMLAIDNITEQEITELTQIIELLEHETEDINVILDKRFHYTIAKASRNVLITDILKALSDMLDKFIIELRRDILRSEDSRIILNEAHQAMMKSLIERDKALAREAINKHFGIIDEKLREKEHEISIK
jgi:GntR family transcriptional repressor for pyruvate dehydrogenase complex